MLHGYNSYTAHHDEPESVYMRKSMEELLFHHRVDIVFAGHVHVYERFVSIIVTTKFNLNDNQIDYIYNL